MWSLLIPVAYLIGTFPSAILVARGGGIDIRQVGSGNPGASNVARTLGWRRGIWVFALDAAKGASTAGMGLLVAGRPAGYILGGAAVMGHVFPIWNRFRGGKGVATGGGIFAVLSPLVFSALIALWFVLSRLTRKASLASIVIVTLLPIGVGLVRREPWEVVATVLISGLVMARHVGNMRRLVSRTERVIT
ncbi:MAG: glycerol-3-phosphate 1-O-acyltransferase PlsY [Ilumatobacteraceae bacterium]